MERVTELISGLVSGLGNRLLQVFTLPTERLYGFYLVAALILALGVYLERRRRALAPDEGLLRFLFPREVYLHRSAKVDYAFAALNRLLYPLIVLPFVVSGATAIALVSGALEAVAPGLRFDLPPGLALDLALSLFAFVALDFGIWLAHYLFHRVPLLWELHKVHHSAEVMTPITVFRMHPLDDALTMSVSGITAGAAQALFLHLFPATGSAIAVWQVNLGIFLFYVVGYNLRHSHIWLDFGWAERLLVSPAMHQIHHSRRREHWDKNMGFVFSFWDRLAGTRVLAEEAGLAEGESLEFGLDGESEEEYQDVFRLYLLPFRKIAAGWSEMLIMTRPTRILLLVTLLLAGGVLAAELTQRGQQPQRVQLAELTWTEVRDRIAAGTRTVIVPTGGTEQNGPHMILGKHNHVVARTAERIAQELGDCLVAPTMAYVPEGRIDPPVDHMRKAGTLSLREEVFEGVLEDTARSLAQHGFTTIAFLGDSLNNQAPQARVAAKLNAEWAGRGVRVIHLDEYYAQNGQIAWLQQRGFADEQIGGHAGIRDTSELLAAHPEGVRGSKRAFMGGSTFAASGVHGD
ncbi:MAG TPA: hypothetical protein DEA08_12175, partial [Planctomycetes bacterium]|nr:hypothetical protein [Planctomycetota bacterium]